MEIPKYRAWVTGTENIMYQPHEVWISHGEVWLSNAKGLPEKKVAADKVLLSRATGCKDQNGAEIFEGDILHHQIQTEYTFIVKYDKDKGRWYGDGLSRTYRIDITKEFLQYYKVIGNIYANQELLENKGE